MCLAPKSSTPGFLPLQVSLMLMKKRMLPPHLHLGQTWRIYLEIGNELKVLGDVSVVPGPGQL